MDFNAVCSNEDRMGGIQVNSEAIIDFQNWILELDLAEVQRSGSKYTCTNFQEGDRRIYQTLNWCFTNNLWYSKIGELLCSILNWSLSDHCSLRVDIRRNTSNIKSPFIFFNIRCNHPEFLSLVEKLWRHPISGNNMIIMCQKLKMLRMELRMLNKREFDMLLGRITKTNRFGECSKGFAN